ncbi:ADP-ribose glycohydrolase MACROD1 isoform X3 [Latimeria chalumnae]|uniref:ADP-ribose glycohydrolase MACROD1 isoform X3 n=1 Tax=Latimeria chalumnae TaxID=7897 RepID=UPI00313D8982
MMWSSLQGARALLADLLPFVRQAAGARRKLSHLAAGARPARAGLEQPWRAGGSPGNSRRRVTTSRAPVSSWLLPSNGSLWHKPQGGVAGWQSGARGRLLLLLAGSVGLKTSVVFAMAPTKKVDLNSSATSWWDAKSYLESLKHNQRQEYYHTKMIVELPQIPTWKDMAQSAEVQQLESKYKEDHRLSKKVSLFRGDITKLEVDAIVNAANSSLLGGGGVDGSIHRAAGPLLKEECRTLNGCQTGEAKITCGYRLPANYVVHTVGPIAHGHPSAAHATDLKNCYMNSLNLALGKNLRTIAFPCISTGVYGYPNESAADVALKTVRDWLEAHGEKVRTAKNRANSKKWRKP